MFKHTTASRAPTMSAVTLQKFVLLQENKVLGQFIRHKSTPAVHRQAISSALAASDLVSYLKLTSRKLTQGCTLASRECRPVASPA